MKFGVIRILFCVLCVRLSGLCVEPNFNAETAEADCTFSSIVKTKLHDFVKCSERRKFNLADK